ncbi:MAG: hypothetical protein WEC59_13600 [Salibacteraceae bacterium]
MKSLVLFTLSAVFSASVQAQDINKEIFQKNIVILYEAAASGFKEIKKESSGTTDRGNAKFHASRKVSGAKDVFIDVDSEDSHTYVALFEANDVESAKKMVEEMTVLASEVLAENGLVRKKGTEMRYEGYRKQTIEYDSDNIDLMGKYPSFEFGVLRDTEPPLVEMVINEPLWK